MGVLGCLRVENKYVNVRQNSEKMCFSSFRMQIKLHMIPQHYASDLKLNPCRRCRSTRIETNRSANPLYFPCKNNPRPCLKSIRSRRKCHLLRHMTTCSVSGGSWSGRPPAVEGDPAGDESHSSSFCGRTGSERVSEEELTSFMSGYRSQYTEFLGFIDGDNIKGEIPRELRGTLFRNGPGIFEIGDETISHPFDGDGLVAAICFPGDGRAPLFANRIVRTKAFMEEQVAGEALFRTAFSTGKVAGATLYNPFDFSVKQVANTGVIRWADRIMALYERDLPYELSSRDLRTVGRTDINGAIKGCDSFAAHYRIYTESDGSLRLIGFSSKESLLDNELKIFELDETGRCLHKTEISIPGGAFGFFHDFVVTEDAYVFLENPMRLNLKKLFSEYMFGKASIAECLDFRSELPVKIHTIRRPGRVSAKGEICNIPTLCTYVSTSSFFSFHHANAFNSSDGRKLIIDTVALPGGVEFSTSLDSLSTDYYQSEEGRGTLTRLIVDKISGDVSEVPLMRRACEFPSVAPCIVGRPHKHIYLLGSRISDPWAWAPPQLVIKATVRPYTIFDSDGPAEQPMSEEHQLIYDPGPCRWAGEPIFVPRESTIDEDDGWILTIVYDSKCDSSELIILDAKDLNLVASLGLPVRLPPGLHGSWSTQTLDRVERVEKKIEYDVRDGGPLRYE